MDKPLIIVIIVLVYLILTNRFVKYSLNLNADSSYLGNAIKKKSRFNYYYEGILITPQNPLTLYLFAKAYGESKPLYIRSLKSYVSFTRLGISQSDKINCDWCSIVNGWIRLCVDSLKHWLSVNPAKLKTIDQHWLNSMDWVLTTVLKNRDQELKKFDIDKFVRQSIGFSYDQELNRKIELYGRIYLMLEQLELRWCPFRGMIDYYRNHDKRFLPINLQTIYYAGKILSKYDKIECHMCNKILNKKMDKRFISNGVSPLQDFFAYILSL